MARNLKRERDPQKRTDILDAIDIPTVTKKLMQILDIRNQESQMVTLTPSHIAQIKKYLQDLDIIISCLVEYGIDGVQAEERILFTQSGMRYCQAQTLVFSLMKEQTFASLDEESRDYISRRLLEEVRGRMMEDIVLMETLAAARKRYKVCKLQFANGEYGMVVYDRQMHQCAAYEIKHSKVCVPEQARHLLDKEKLARTSRRFGKIVGRYILYLGEELDTEDGIAYRNAQAFLKNLPDIALESGLEDACSESEVQMPLL